LIEHPDADLFDIERLRQQADAQSLAAGRSHAVFFNHQDQALVLKHYQRGGKIAAVMGDKYIGNNCERSRAFREWRLLQAMRELALPVPLPVAAHCERYGLFHRADLVTRQIHDVTPLAEHLLHHRCDQKTWAAIGHCIRRFHDASVYHADLNARNILLNVDTRDIYLIDFDKGAFRYLGDAWKAANVARLQRSLFKIKSLHQSFNFDPADWSALLGGYNSSDVRGDREKFANEHE
jgi:tRNA A-37 threonylcarbamoyl transferase component Bud32